MIRSSEIQPVSCVASDLHDPERSFVDKDRRNEPLSPIQVEPRRLNAQVANGFEGFVGLVLVVGAMNVAAFYVSRVIVPTPEVHGVSNVARVEGNMLSGESLVSSVGGYTMDYITALGMGKDGAQIFNRTARIINTGGDESRAVREDMAQIFLRSFDLIKDPDEANRFIDAYRGANIARYPDRVEIVDYFCNLAQKAVLAWGEMCLKPDMSEICVDPVKFLEYARDNLGYDPDVTQNLISTLVTMK